jgi:hypothetical protein
MHLECSLGASAKQSSKTSGGASALAARLAQTDSDKVTEPIRAEIVELVYPSKDVREFLRRVWRRIPDSRTAHRSTAKACRIATNQSGLLQSVSYRRV